MLCSKVSLTSKRLCFSWLHKYSHTGSNAVSLFSFTHGSFSVFIPNSANFQATPSLSQTSSLIEISSLQTFLPPTASPFQCTKPYIVFHILSSQQFPTLIHPYPEHSFWAFPSISPYCLLFHCLHITICNYVLAQFDLCFFPPPSIHPLATTCNCAECSLYTSSLFIRFSTPVSTFYSGISSILLSAAATSNTKPSSIYWYTPLQPCHTSPHTCSIIKHPDYDKS